MFVLKAEINNFFKKAILEESTQENFINTFLHVQLIALFFSIFNPMCVEV